MTISLEPNLRGALIILFFLLMPIGFVLNSRIMRKLRNGQSIYSISAIFRSFSIPEVYVFILLAGVVAGLGFAISKLPH
jgi:hypothetical protein